MASKVLAVDKLYSAQVECASRGKTDPIYKEIQNLIDLITSQRKSTLISKAIGFAFVAHTGQTRKGTSIPYVIHPLRVGLTLTELDCSDEVIAAGILHDTVEDTPNTYEDLNDFFGETVAKLVEGASEPDKSDTWENRKHHTIDYLKTAPREVLLISAADKLDNIKETEKHLKEVGEKHWSAFKRPRDQQKWYYQSLAEVFLNHIDDDATNRLFTEFKSKVAKVFG